MKILALDTSSAACSVALLEGDHSRIHHEVIPMQHAKCLLPFINEMLSTESSSVDAFAWGCGPGSFTGLRIGAATIQALGFAFQKPVINVSSLASLAQTAYLEHGWKRLLVAVDARMGEIYWGAYSINEAGYAEPLHEEGLCTPSQLPEILASKSQEPWYAVGGAWAVYEEQLCPKFNLISKDSASLPKALAVAVLGRLKYESGLGVQAFEALPQYLRDQVC